jgi:uncharacterized membrane-anchored protein YhcB (DUF1043 family)
MLPIVAISTPRIGMIGRTLDNNLNDSSHIPRFLPMSESRGKVYSLMETNSDTQTTESEASAAASRFAELQQLVAAMATDFEKFYRDGNKAAGTRVRNSMQELKAFAQRVREEVLTLRNQDKEQPQ